MEMQILSERVGVKLSEGVTVEPKKAMLPLNELLKEWQERSGVSASAFCKKANMDRGNLSKAFKRKSGLRLESVIALMRVWNIPTNELDRLILEEKKK